MLARCRLENEVTMKSVRSTCLSFLAFLAFLACGSAVAQSSGPDARQITDPKTITSASNPNARPIPTDDLYFTRSVSSASWSPGGKEIAFTTDISGRANLWKVNADGGWPIQLAQSDERQYGDTWSPDGKWIVFQQDTGGNELWDIFAIPSDGEDIPQLISTGDRKSTRLNSSHQIISYAVFCLKKKKNNNITVQ